jgi:signal peptidase II
MYDMQEARGASLSDADTQSTRPAGHRRTLLLAVVAAVAYVLDQVSKYVVASRLEGKSPIDVLGGILTLRVIRNSGAAFSIASGMTIILSAVAVAVVVVIVRTARRLRSAGWAVALGLVLGGALGNLTDRVFRSPGVLRGHVVDWIELPHWPIFNLADSAICCGAVLVALLTFLGRQLDGTVHRG